MLLMGLDMYLLSKSKNHQKSNPKTGACNGLFPLTIATEDHTIEIGYWRKNYRLADKLTKMLFANGEEDNCVEKEMTDKQIESIIAFAEDELEFKDYDNGWYNDEDWQYTIKTFKDALNRYNNGEHILYEQWY